jgi:uncharacterized protein
MFVKIHKSYRDVVAICDSELLGKRFEEEKFQLDVKESFFGGEEQSKEDAIKTMQSFSDEDSTFNIIGEKSVNTAIEAGIINENHIGNIDNIPFALVLA